MAGVLRAARETYARIEGRAAPFYGFASALGVAVPLLAGALTDHAAASSVVALGAYLVAFAGPSGPYGAQARSLATTVAVVTAGATFGGLLIGHPWVAVAVVPVIVALGAALPWVGNMAALAVLLTAIRPPADGVLANGLLELLGGIWITALLLAPWPARRLRPLRQALAEAADAVAATLDAVAQQLGPSDDAALRGIDPDLAAVARLPDWETQRRAASKALTNARTTYGLYRADRDREQPTEPERLIEALARTLHETVALHAQIEALTRTTPDPTRPPTPEPTPSPRAEPAPDSSTESTHSPSTGLTRGPTSEPARGPASETTRGRSAESTRSSASEPTPGPHSETTRGSGAESVRGHGLGPVLGDGSGAALGRTGWGLARGRGWDLDVRVAVTALAARLRLLAGAISAARPTPLGSTDSAAVRRLAKQCERIWQAGQGEGDDLVAAALVGQVRRSIDRLAGSVESARRIVAGDLHIAPALPSLPERTWPGEVAPWGWWRQVVTAVRTRSPLFRQMTRVGLAVLVAMAIAAAFRLPHGHWLTITVILSLRGTYGETVARVVQRVAGTAIGAAIAAVLLTLAPDQVTAALILFVCALMGFTLRSVNYGFWALFGTPLVMMLLDFTTPADWTAAGVRIGLTVAGGVLAVLAARLLWPAGTAQLLPDRLARLLTTHAELARTAAAVADGTQDGLPRDRLAAAERATDEVNAARAELAHEPSPDTGRIAQLRSAVRAAQRLRDDLIAISRIAREDIDDAGPIPAILDRVADHLDEAASAAGGHTPPPALDLHDQLADLDDYLSSLTRRRRSELSGGVAVDETTPLRRALLQAAGVRHTLRALRGNAEELSLSASGRR